MTENILGDIVLSLVIFSSKLNQEILLFKLFLQWSPPFSPPPVSALTSPSKTGITGLLLLLRARGPLGVWDTTREVGTALRGKKSAGPLRCTSAFLFSSVKLSLTATSFR